MSIVNIRICEENDAKLMLKDGSLLDFIETWTAEFPGEGLGKLHLIKEIKAHCGCTLLEAKHLADAAGMRDEIRFQIGDKLYVTRSGGGNIWVYRKAGSAWNCLGEIKACLHEWILFPTKTGRKRMEFGEF